MMESFSIAPFSPSFHPPQTLPQKKPQNRKHSISTKKEWEDFFAGPKFSLLHRTNTELNFSLLIVTSAACFEAGQREEN